MFCPLCRDEFRPGFTRCGRCDVDLVAELSSSQRPPSASRAERSAPPSRALVDFCGFLSLDEARQARDTLWSHGLGSEIAIRSAHESSEGAPVDEEFWLRVPSGDFRQVTELLGFDAEPEAQESVDESLACSECNEPVGAEERFCAHCGARFEDAG